MLNGELKDTDWGEIEDGMIKEWYYVSKIMGKVFEPEFPYFVFKAISECIREDPSFKSSKEEN